MAQPLNQKRFVQFDDNGRAFTDTYVGEEEHPGDGWYQIPIGSSCTYYTLEDGQAILNRVGLDTRAGEVVYVRERRPELLQKTDYVMFAPVKPEVKANLEAYRQWLRDLPELIEAGRYPVGCVPPLEYDSGRDYNI
jgi:hypothetical protein